MVWPLALGLGSLRRIGRRASEMVEIDTAVYMSNVSLNRLRDEVH